MLGNVMKCWMWLQDVKIWGMGKCDDMTHMTIKIIKMLENYTKYYKVGIGSNHAQFINKVRSLGFSTRGIIGILVVFCGLPHASAHRLGDPRKKNENAQKFEAESGRWKEPIHFHKHCCTPVVNGPRHMWFHPLHPPYHHGNAGWLFNHVV